MFKAVLFDFDGVLVDSMPFHVQAWQEVFRAYGIEIRPEEVLLTEGCRSIELAAKVFAERGRSAGNGALQELVARKQQRYQEITKASMDDAAPGLITRLKNENRFTGLVTGTSRSNVEKVLSREHLALFDVLVTGDEVANGKPDPEAYLKAAEILEVPPSECLVVENAPLGIQAAKQAGMNVVALTTTLDVHLLKGADFYAENLADLEKNWERMDCFD